MSTGDRYTVNLGPVGRVMQAVGEVDLGAPAELCARAGDVKAAAFDLPGACLREYGREVAVGVWLERLDDVEHRAGASGPDVVLAVGLRVIQDGEQPGDHVADVDIVPGLAPGPIDRRALAVLETPAEDRDDAGLAERILTRTVDIA